MKKRLTAAEKWLFIAPIAFLGFITFLFLWKRNSVPKFVSTPMPVLLAQFLPEGKMLVVMQPLLRTETFPIVAIYNWHSGNQLVSRALAQQIGVNESELSPDRKFWLTSETTSNERNPTVVLRNLKNLEVLRSFNGSGGHWLDNRRFTVFGPKGTQLWGMDENGKLTSRKFKPEHLTNLSPDGKWGVEYWEGKPVAYSESYGGSSNPSKANYLPNYETVISLPDRKKRVKLPGETWRSITWKKDSRQLYGVVGLMHVSPTRGDILSFDVASQKVSSVRLEMPPNFSFAIYTMNFRFSPDCRILAAGFRNGSLLIWNTSTGKLLKTLIDDGNYYYPASEQPEFSPDGENLMHLTLQGAEIYRMDQILPR